jgi:hypothetical protein
VFKFMSDPSGCSRIVDTSTSPARQQHADPISRARQPPDHMRAGAVARDDPDPNQDR